MFVSSAMWEHGRLYGICTANGASGGARGALALTLALGATACSGVSDCKEDAAKCAEMLNQNAAACAEAFKYKQSDSKRKRCSHAIDVVGSEGTAAAVPGLLEILKVPESGVHDDIHRSEAATALGKIGDPQAVDGLMAALDMKVGTSNDPVDKMGNRSNEEVAQALGELGEDRAVGKLLELMEATRDNNVALWAMRSLGKLGSAEAVPALEKVALEHDNKFMRKNAVIALGDIASPESVDALVQMMFIEFQGVSFYREASFALFQVGPAAVPKLLETLALKNEKVADIFEKSGGMKESAVIAKSAVVLGDLRDPRATEALVEAYATALKKNDPIVIREVAFALGSLADENAVPVLMKNMTTIDASLRERVMESLNKIGSREPVPEMVASMTAKDFIKRCIKQGIGRGPCTGDVASRVGAQKASTDAATFLVDADHVAAMKKVVAGEEQEELKAYMEKRLAVAELVSECAVDAACWAKKATDEDELVREKAYWELGRIGGDVAKKTLLEGLSDKKRKARAAAIYSYWKVGDSSAVEQIEAQLQKEKGSADFLVVNEDLKRLAIDLKRKSS